jgi:hypothetical protein
MVERLLNTKIISVQSDWGGEYRNLHSYFQSHGITHRLSCPHTHQQQGCAERKHRHLIDTTLAVLAKSSLPQKFWEDACLNSCYLINRMPTPLLNNQSPFEKLFHQVPDYKFLKVFGCACFPNLRPYNTHKFSQRSKECVFLGHNQHHKGYKCLHIEYGRVYISQDVIFHESRFLILLKVLQLLLILLLFKLLFSLLFFYLYPLDLQHNLLHHHLHLYLPILQHHTALVPVPMRKLLLPDYTSHAH